MDVNETFLNKRVRNGIIVTIGLCVKNVEATIQEAVSSVIDQDFPHELMEIIVVDGQSQDKTLSIIKEHLSKTHIKTMFYAENEGLGFARRLVADNASGDYIVWVDGDVILSKDYVKRQVNFMEQHPSVGIARGRYGVLPEDNWVATLENINYVVESYKHRGKAYSKLLGTEGSIFRVKAIRRVASFDCSIKGAREDSDIAYKIRKAGWKFFITDTLFYEKQRRTWKTLWIQHSWYGYGLHYFQHKNRGQNAPHHRWVDNIPLSPLAYKLTRRKIVFLLPLNFAFTKTALLLGYARAHIDGYGHQ